jgi:hypothetical protein
MIESTHAVGDLRKEGSAFFWGNPTSLPTCDSETEREKMTKTHSNPETNNNLKKYLLILPKRL